MAIRVNHPSFLQLPVTHKLTQKNAHGGTDREWDETGTLDGVVKKLGREAHVESARSEEMEGSERPGGEKKGKSDG